MSHNWITIKGNNNLSNYIDISSKYYSGNDINIYNTPSKYWNTHINQLNNIKDNVSNIVKEYNPHPKKRIKRNLGSFFLL